MPPVSRSDARRRTQIPAHEMALGFTPARTRPGRRRGKRPSTGRLPANLPLSGPMPWQSLIGGLWLCPTVLLAFARDALHLWLFGLPLSSQVRPGSHPTGGAAGRGCHARRWRPRRRGRDCSSARWWRSCDGRAGGAAIRTCSGLVEGDGGGGGVAEQMRVDRLAEGLAGVGDDVAVGMDGADPRAPLRQPQGACCRRRDPAGPAAAARWRDRSSSAGTSSSGKGSSIGSPVLVSAPGISSHQPVPAPHQLPAERRAATKLASRSGRAASRAIISPSR